MNCMWCDSTEAKESLNTVYWELPDGTKAIETKRHHAFLFLMWYGLSIRSNSERNRRSIVLIYTKDLPKQLTYEELMGRPRLLKRNYFDF